MMFNKMLSEQNLEEWKVLDSIGYPEIIGYWKLSEEDLEEIEMTGSIMPPVYLFTDDH